MDINPENLNSLLRRFNADLVLYNHAAGLNLEKSAVRVVLSPQNK